MNENIVYKIVGPTNKPAEVKSVKKSCSYNARTV